MPPNHMETAKEGRMEDYITEKQYAEMRGVSTRTIMRERSGGNGPPFIKLGKVIYYRKEALKAWLLAQEVQK